MTLTVVVGGQFGSEGKGKLVAHLAATDLPPTYVVRCGGPNSGHTVRVAGRKFVFRQLPASALVEESNLFLGAGMIVDVPLLFEEMEACKLPRERLSIDRNAAILAPEDSSIEEGLGLRNRTGSTLSGTGYATARKALRDPNQLLCGHVRELAGLVGNVSSSLNDALDRDKSVIVEGTQGFGLSLHHSDAYPFVTSRDTTASGFLSEVGLSPRLVTDIVMVVRTFPIRVAGNSGPLRPEITWTDLSNRCGAPELQEEFTSVTGKLRRVGEFDWELAQAAARTNRPTALAVHGIDYLNFGDRGRRSFNELSKTSQEFVSLLEERLQIPVKFVFTGPDQEDMIDLRVSDEELIATSARRDIAV